MKGRALALVLAIAAALAVGSARQYAQGERATAACDVALEKGDLGEAIARARLAAESLAPGSPYPARGYERLGKIATDAEARGDDATASAAWRAARAAATETRALGAGETRAAWAARADAGLARLAARGAASAVSAPAPPARDDGPSPWELALVAASVVALYALTERFLRRKRP